jgi:hypothetical protein
MARIKTDTLYPRMDDSGVLTGGEMVGTSYAAGEQVVSRYEGCFADPGRERVAGLISDFEPHGTLGLLLQNCGASSNAIPMTDIAHAQIQQVAGTQLAVNRQI